jgi:hypothetical protein
MVMLPGKRNTLYSGIYRQLRTQYCLSKHLIILVLILFGCFYAGCSGEGGKQNGSYMNLNLNTPEIEGRVVSLNGGVAVPIERIQWDWGDGQIVNHQFFPGSHTYSAPGAYEIKVTAFDKKNRTATKSVKVEIR